MLVDLMRICGGGGLGCLCCSETAVWMICGEMRAEAPMVVIIARSVCIDVGKLVSQMGVRYAYEGCDVIPLIKNFIIVFSSQMYG